MDIKERMATAEQKLKNDDKRIEKLEGIAASWNTLIRKIILKTVGWLIAVLTTGVVFGWNLPENVQKALSEWMQK